MRKNKPKMRPFQNDKYKDIFFVEKYVALWAYGYLNNFGQSEGLYRTINELGFNGLDKNAKHKILDVGCGVGRTAADYARFFKNSEVIGIDNARLMIDMARRINKTDEKIYLDMNNLGFGKMSIDGEKIENLNFQEITLADFYLKSLRKNYDLIIAVNFIDRVADIKQSLKIIRKLLKVSGIFILSTPLNFSNVQDWEMYGSFESLSKLMQKVGFSIEVKFDGLTYNEILDARGAVEEYPTLVMKLVKIR